MKTEIRKKNSDKVLEFLDSLNIEDIEKRKVLSRTYTELNKKIKNIK